MITKLRLDNFKSWKTTGDLQLAPITGFFGANSSGKTSLLQSLLLLKQTVESSDRNQTLDLGKPGEASYVELGSFEQLIFSHDKNRSLSFELEWNLRKELIIANPETPKSELFRGKKIGFSTEIYQKQSDSSINVKQLYYYFDELYFRYQRRNGSDSFELKTEPATHPFRFKMTPGRKWYPPAPIKFYGFPDQSKFYYQNAGFIADFQFQIELLFNNVFYLGPLRDFPKREYVWSGSQPEDMGRRGEKAVDAILVSDKRETRIKRGYRKHKKLLSECVAFWMKKIGLIDSFSIKPLVEGGSYYQVWVRKNPDSPEVLLTDVGFGVSQILPVITLCFYAAEGSILLIEQPEIHLHPSVQAGLADVFIDAVKTRKIQIILESHSEHLLRRLQRRMAEEALKPDEVALFFCKTTEGASVAERLQTDMFGNISNYPADFFGDELGEIAAMSKAQIQQKRKIQSSR
jgi:AAA15 family ATPase/GTPase